MKKLFTLFLTLFVASSVWAYDFKSDDGIYYNYVSQTENTVAVTYKDTKYNSYSGNVTIPSSVTYNGKAYTVTSIENSAFKGCTALTSVTIPNNVTSIGSNAFNGCTGLTSISIPNSVTSIGSNAFNRCRALTSITIPNSVTSIGSDAFNGCTALTSITIPNSVTSIGGNTFYGCTGLTSISIPNSVTSIGGYAFYGCTSLTSITIPSSMTSIGEYAFYGFTGLTSVTIPNNVISIGECAFCGCWGLDSITIPSSVREIGKYAFMETNFKSITNNSKQEIYMFGFTKDGIRYICSSGIAIVTALFEGKYSGDVTISNYVEFCGNTYEVINIDEQAFSDCTELTSVTTSCLSSTVSTLFKGCTNLKKLTFLHKPFHYTTFVGINTKDIYLYVPCEYYEEYTSSEYYFTLDFEHIECIGSEKVELQKDEVIVEPERTEAIFSMPINESANSYTLTIQNNGVTFCTLTFNAQGQLANIDFSTTKSYELKAGVSGYQFTVTGLSSATKYGYSFKALASNKSVLKEYTGSFTTKNADGTGGSSQGGEEVGGGSGEGGEGGEGGEQGGEGGNQTAINGVSNATAVAIVGDQILINGEAPAFVVTISGKKIANQNLKAGVYFVNVEGETVKVVK